MKTWEQKEERFWKLPVNNVCYITLYHSIDEFYVARIYIYEAIEINNTPNYQWDFIANSEDAAKEKCCIFAREFFTDLANEIDVKIDYVPAL